MSWRGYAPLSVTEGSSYPSISSGGVCFKETVILSAMRMEAHIPEYCAPAFPCQAARAFGIAQFAIPVSPLLQGGRGQPGGLPSTACRRCSWAGSCIQSSTGSPACARRRLAVSRQGDEAGDRKNPHAARHHRLRDDRNSPASTQASVDDAFDRRVPTVGRTQPRLEVKSVAGSVAPVGVAGEFRTREHHARLLGRPGAEGEGRRRKRLDACGRPDADGCFNIVGRMKDMAVCGGGNLHPREGFAPPEGRPGVRRPRRQVRRRVTHLAMRTREEPIRFAGLRRRATRPHGGSRGPLDAIREAATPVRPNDRRGALLHAASMVITFRPRGRQMEDIRCRRF